MTAFVRIYINILISEQPISDTIIEETLSSDLQQTVEKVSKPDIEKSTQEIHNTGNTFMKSHIVNNYQVFTKS